MTLNGFSTITLKDLKEKNNDLYLGILATIIKLENKVIQRIDSNIITIF